ncbi:RbsD/FucU domain-containing protein [Jonesiaceae bacterium BS-20]|uniref:RbsD/FucU domain-containing protein n=1 Tax=Jonesiaceae bacterium BS-20 TaxID=3120821 RepID=A0AAU7DT90_9MICO
MLIGISPLITPDMLWTIAAMGHGDVLAVVDRNYPSYGLHARVHNSPGVDTTTMITELLALFPLDEYVHNPVKAMVPDDDLNATIKSHSALAAPLLDLAGRKRAPDPVPRTKFYEEAKSAFAVIMTGDDRPFSCFLLTKGVV